MAEIVLVEGTSSILAERGSNKNKRGINFSAHMVHRAVFACLADNVLGHEQPVHRRRSSRRSPLHRITRLLFLQYPAAQPKAARCHIQPQGRRARHIAIQLTETDWLCDDPTCLRYIVPQFDARVYRVFYRVSPCRL